MKVLRVIHFPLFVLLLIVFTGNSSSSQSHSHTEILLQDARFSILAEALEKTGLMEILDGKGSITLFAPTNEAFGEFFKRMSVTNLSDLSVDQLKPILMFHIVSHRIPSAGLYPGSIETLNKNAGLGIKVEGENVILNNDTGIVIKDIKTTNGFIHVIDKVMIPHIRSNKESGSGHC